MEQVSNTQETPKKKSLPIAGKVNVVQEELERELKEFEASERERLGMKRARKQWVDHMLKPEMTRKERENVTLLIGGLTAAQDFLVEGALRGLGYKVEYMSCPDNAALQVGKEFGNRAQCNPTYFTVGNLVKHLQQLRDEKGLSSQEIVKNYLFLTAGACGPCRFGMYVTEYRKALRDAGFDGFRVMLFQQQGGLSQATGEEVGIEMNPAFFISIIKGVVCGDVLNAIGYRIRPYEVEPGATNRAMEEAKRIIYKALFEGTNVFMALAKCKPLFEGIKVDKLRPRPKTAIIGEFWAMTTEGDGNYALQRFIESEGGECDIQLTTAWLLYNIWEVARDTRVRSHLREADGGKYGLEGMDEVGIAKRLAMLRLADAGLRVGFNAFAIPAGLYHFHLPDMDEVAEVADGFYSNDLRGGEGHMEVGKLILNVAHNKAHATVSVKPFGCMPSSGVSDGVQTIIQSKHPGTIFCAVETSGDGATNFYSRVQMYMFKARIAAEEELAKAYETAGVTEAEVRDFLATHPKYASPLHHAPHTVAGSAANLVYEVAPIIKKSRLERAQAKAIALGGKVIDLVKRVPAKAAEVKALATNPETYDRLRNDGAVVYDMARGKAMDHIRPIAQKLLGKAVFENNPEVTTVGYSEEAIAAE
ncbi:MAG: 2-hydroxyglutaryl-CoA dehydratase [Polyangiaceae bacterium]|nr:2-hydroxyglutaryl-CoA dehydratase [Polyangiaceae bacterium]